jgi:hypothetical protein
VLIDLAKAGGLKGFRALVIDLSAQAQGHRPLPRPLLALTQPGNSIRIIPINVKCPKRLATL